MPNIALISDLHIGRARAGDLNPAGQSDDGSEFLVEFKNFIDECLDEIDYLFVSGDITNAGNKLEVECAAEVIEKLALFLKVEKKNIFWAPGNHDRSWDMIKASGDPKEAYHYFDELNFLDYQSVSGYGELFSPPYFKVRETDDLFVVSINTSAFDVPDSAPHHGKVDSSSIDKLVSYLDGNELKEDKISVFLLHHHPIDYPDLAHVNKPDFSVLQNSANLVDALTKYKFDMVVHGHRHYPSFKYEATPIGHFIAFFCAGSFSASLDPKDSVFNQFHVVEVDSERTDEGFIKGVYKSWAYLGERHGWKKSSYDYSVIQHKLGFGMYSSQSKFFVDLDNDIQGYLAQKNSFKWVSFLEDNPNYNFYPQSLVHEGLKYMSEKKGLKLHNAEDLDYLVIIGF